MDINKVKFLRESLTITACLSHNKSKAQISKKEEIKMSINLSYFEVASENLQYILRSYKIKSAFYTENTLQKLLLRKSRR